MFGGAAKKIGTGKEIWCGSKTFGEGDQQKVWESQKN